MQAKRNNNVLLTVFKRYQIESFLALATRQLHSLLVSTTKMCGKTLRDGIPNGLLNAEG